MAADRGMKVAVRAAWYNMILQVIFRLGTFCMNAILLRYMSREVLGVVNVRLTLLYTTILFISREAFRKACLSKDEKKMDLTSEERKRVLNLIWMSIAVGFLSSLLLCFLWVFCLEQPSYNLVYKYRLCTVLIGFAALLELLVEPLWIFGQRYSFVMLKVVLEGIYLTLRCLISIFLVVIFPQLGLYSFAIAFVVAASVYVFMYYGCFWWYINHVGTITESEKNTVLPFDSFNDIFPDFYITHIFDTFYTNLVLSFYKQSLLKQFLTEGERYVMTVFSILSFAEQGVYDVISNLGSLAARFIFMPIEESYYIFFSQILTRGTSAKNHPQDTIKQSANALSVVLKFVSLLGFIILVFGYSYSYLLLDLYGGKLLSDSEGPILLKAYCVYVLVIAINGITECFMFAGMSQAEVDRYNYKMLLFSVVFLLSSLVLTKYFGAVGFILANCLNMVLRITQSMMFIKRFFQDTSYRPLLSVLPQPNLLVSFAASFMVMSASETLLCCSYGRIYQLLHIAIGGICLTFVLVMIYFTEQELISFAASLLKKRKDKTQ